MLIQFGHNDAIISRPGRFAAATTAYRDNLLRMIQEAKDKALIPVLVSPPVQRVFVGAHIQTDLAEYSQMICELAVTTGTQVIDLEARSAAFFERIGSEAAKRYYLHYRAVDRVSAFPGGVADDTHFSELGARIMALFVVQELKALPIPVAKKVLSELPEPESLVPHGNTSCG